MSVSGVHDRDQNIRVEQDHPAFRLDLDLAAFLAGSSGLATVDGLAVLVFA
jgi:hypothetical protein